jgi:N6-adenosine-specific RNA methylase IME4
MRPTFIQPDMFSPGVKEWPFGSLEPQAYSLIMIDCAWHFDTRSEKGEAKSPQAHYRTMPLYEIRALPVADLARENCLLWMWATQPMLNVQCEILEGWGFKFFSSGVWVKTTKHGKLAFGTGYGFRCAHESILLGTRGAPAIASKSVRSVIMAPVREYSRKPDEAYEAARSMIPYGRAADVYSRETRPKWESFGDQAGHFDEVAA